MRFLLVALLLQSSALEINFYPSIVGDGASARLICRVAKNKDNRKLVLGVENETSSERQLDGDSAAIQHVLNVPVVTCAAGEAYCELWNSVKIVSRKSVPFIVAGCQAGKLR